MLGKVARLWQEGCGHCDPNIHGHQKQSAVWRGRTQAYGWTGMFVGLECSLYAPLSCKPCLKMEVLKNSQTVMWANIALASSISSDWFFFCTRPNSIASFFTPIFTNSCLLPYSSWSLEPELIFSSSSEGGIWHTFEKAFMLYLCIKLF